MSKHGPNEVRLSDFLRLSWAFPEPLRTHADLGVGTISSVRFPALALSSCELKSLLASVKPKQSQ